MEKEHLEILLEDIRGKFDIVLEGHEVLRKQIVDVKDGLEEKIDVVNVRIDGLAQKVDKLDQRMVRVEVEVGTLNQNVGFLAEGHQMLSDKIDRVGEDLGGRIDCVKWKVDGVAADLSAHRADTEAHPPLWRVKE